MIDALGDIQTQGYERDCCISGQGDLIHGDRDRIHCFGRNVAGMLGIDTAGICPVCPASLIN